MVWDLCSMDSSNITKEFSEKRKRKIPLGTKGRTSILSVESSASCGADSPGTFVSGLFYAALLRTGAASLAMLSWRCRSALMPSSAGSSSRAPTTRWWPSTDFVMLRVYPPTLTLNIQCLQGAEKHLAASLLPRLLIYFRVFSSSSSRSVMFRRLMPSVDPLCSSAEVVGGSTPATPSTISVRLKPTMKR